MLLIYSEEVDGCGQNVPEKLPEKAEIRERSQQWLSSEVEEKHFKQNSGFWSTGVKTERLGAVYWLELGWNGYITRKNMTKRNAGIRLKKSPSTKLKV